jgi:ribonucleotide reductase beta subunit family protein with ferritin-like domain|tara:strand:+ start:8543 stop:9466 length:924 start_codon:yes stop_codon:yes gene_type:complete
MNKKRYSIYPLQHPDLFDLYKTHRKDNWTEEEIDFNSDRFSSLTVAQQRMVKKLIFFFANSDAIVADNIFEKLMGNMPLEGELFLSYKLYNENIHMITYGDLIEAYIPNVEEKEKAYDAIYQSDFVAKKLQWAEKYTNESSSFAESLVADMAIEAIYFSSTFAAIFWLKELQLPLNGLFKANLSILKDELTHYGFDAYYYKNHLEDKLDEVVVKNMFLDAVDVEKNFIDDFIGDGVEGVNGEELKKYVEFVCDVVLENMGYPKHFNTTHNLRFMDSIGVQKTVNFFETRSSNYIRTEGSVNINMDNF